MPSNKLKKKPHPPHPQHNDDDEGPPLAVSGTIAVYPHADPPVRRPPALEVEDYVGPNAIRHKGKMIDRGEAERILSLFEGDDLDSEMVLQVLLTYSERPLRLRRDGFTNGCRFCGRLWNYCDCEYGRKTLGTSLR